MATIGFIGLGNMGAPMAANLLKAGHQVIGYDLVASARAALEERGGRAVASAAEAAAAGEIVITMLPAGPQVREGYLGPDGIIARAKPDALLIDCSTIDVETARAVAANAGESQLLMLDAPVSGGVIGAEAGTLTFMVGGEAPPYARPGADSPGNGPNDRPCRSRRQWPERQDLQQHDPRRLDDRGLRGVRACRKAGALGPDLVRHLQQIDQPVLGDDRLLPGPGSGPGGPLESRLRPRLYRRQHAEGSAPRAAGGRRHRHRYPARRFGGQSLPDVRRQRRRRARFLRHHAVHKLATVQPMTTKI